MQNSDYTAWGIRQFQPPRFSLTSAWLVLACLVQTTVVWANNTALPVGYGAEKPLTLDHAQIRQLEADGATIGRVVLNRLNIFDSNNPSEQARPYKAVNAVHVTTRESTIRGQLLFKTGDRLSQQLLEETERALRNNRYIYDASIKVTRVNNNLVDLVVTTQDVWTLKAGVSGGRSGGANTSGVELEETNFLGTGATVKIARKNSVDRNSTQYLIRSINIAGTHIAASTAYTQSDDGRSYALSIGKPFYSLDTKIAGEFSLQDSTQIEQIYDLGGPVDEYQHLYNAYSISTGLSRGLQNGWSRRYYAGVRKETHTFASTQSQIGSLSQPIDVKFFYPFLGVEFIQDRFATTQNLRQIDRTEDIHVGTRVSGTLGYAADLFGNADPALLATVAGSLSIGDINSHLLMLSAHTESRFHRSARTRQALDLEVEYFWRQSPKHLFLTRLNSSTTRNLDSYEQLFLGGDSGLRGYPLRYQRGNHLVSLTMEQRFYTDWQPFRLFQIGGAAFVDAGRVWNDTIDTATAKGWLADAGIGLRLGNRRSGSGRMIHIDLAFPLTHTDDIDSVQLLVGTKKQF